MAEPALSNTDGAQAMDADGNNANFIFIHKVFSVSGAYFAMDARREEAAFYMRLGDLDVSLTLSTLRREFHIDADSPDDRLLILAAKGLQYVKEIRPNDSIPRELLDGTASWSVEERHQAVARAKLIVQVGACITRGADTNFTMERLLAYTENPTSREEVQTAFAEMAESIGLGRDKKQEVVDRIETYARELSYIEALRDLLGDMRTMDQKVARFLRVYNRDRVLVEELQRIQKLLQRPIAEFSERFLQIDAQTGEITALLKNMTRQVEYIRNVRDELRATFLKWGDLFATWRELKLECGRAAERAIRALYRFLATAYAPTIDWR